MLPLRRVSQCYCALWRWEVQLVLGNTHSSGQTSGQTSTTCRSGHSSTSVVQGSRRGGRSAIGPLNALQSTVASGRYLEAAKTLQETSLKGAPASVLNILIALFKGAVAARDVELTNKLKASISIISSQLGGSAHEQVLRALCETGHVQEAFQYLCNDVPARYAATAAYNMLLKHCIQPEGPAKEGAAQLGLSCLHHMKQQGIRQNRITMRFQMCLAMALDDVDMLHRAWQDILKDSKKPPTLVEHKLRVRALAKLSGFDASFEALQEMVEGAPHTPNLLKCVRIATNRVLCAVRKTQSSPHRIRELHNSVVYDVLLSHGMPLSRDMFGIIMWTENTAGASVQEVEGRLAEMRSHALLPNEYHYGSLLSAVSHDGSVERAHEAFNNMREQGLPLVYESYKILIQAHALVGDIKGAHEVYTWMAAENMTSRADVFSLLIGSINAWRAMQANESPTFEVGRTVRVRAKNFRTMGRMEAGELLSLWMEDMRRLSVSYDWPLLVPLITALGCCGNWQELQKIVQQTPTILQGAPPESARIFYNACITAYSRTDDKFRTALKLFEEMLTKGIKPDGTTYDVLIAGCGTVKKPDIAKNLFVHMLRQGVAPTAMTYNSYIKALAFSGRLGPALQLLDDMNKVDIIPGDDTWKVLMEACHKQKNKEMLNQVVLRQAQSSKAKS